MNGKRGLQELQSLQPEHRDGYISGVRIEAFGLFNRVSYVYFTVGIIPINIHSRFSHVRKEQIDGVWKVLRCSAKPRVGHVIV